MKTETQLERELLQAVRRLVLEGMKKDDVIKAQSDLIRTLKNPAFPTLDPMAADPRSVV